MDLNFSKFNENVKDSKKVFMSFWRLSKNGTNHPSIAQRGVSCSKVGLGEPVPRRQRINFLCFENINGIIVLNSI